MDSEGTEKIDRDEKIITVVREAAGLDCSRTLDEERRTVLARVVKYLKEKKERLLLEIAEKNRENAENQARVDLLKARLKHQESHIASRRQYHAEIVRRMASEEVRRDNLLKQYDGMIQCAKERWESYLETYNRRPLARKKIELENKLKLLQFQALYEDQRLEDVEKTIVQMEQMQKLICEVRGRERDRLAAQVMKDTDRLQDLDRIKTEKFELLARLKAEKAEMDREKQRLQEPSALASLIIPTLKKTPVESGQLGLPDYGIASQPVRPYIRNSQFPPAQTNVVQSQCGVIMSFNRRETPSRIIEERCIMVVTSAAVTASSGVPMTNPSGDPSGDSAPVDAEMTDQSAPLVSQDQEPNAEEQTDNAHDRNCSLVDPEYAGSSSSQTSSRDMFSQEARTPTASPFKSAMPYFQEDNEAAASQPPQLAQSGNLVPVVSATHNQPVEQESQQQTLAASINQSMRSVSLSQASSSENREPPGSSALARPSSLFSRLSATVPRHRPSTTTFSQSALGKEKPVHSSEGGKMDSCSHSQPQVHPRSETVELRTQSQLRFPRPAAAARPQAAFVSTTPPASPLPPKRPRTVQPNQAPLASLTPPNFASSIPTRERTFHQPINDENRSYPQPSDPNLVQTNFAHTSQVDLAKQTQSQSKLDQVPVPIQANQASPPPGTGTHLATPTQTNVGCPTALTLVNFARPSPNHPDPNLAPPTPSEVGLAPPAPTEENPARPRPPPSHSSSDDPPTHNQGSLLAHSLAKGNLARPPPSHPNLVPSTHNQGDPAHPSPSHPTQFPLTHSQTTLAHPPQVNVARPQPSPQASLTRSPVIPTHRNLAPVTPTQTNLVLPSSRAHLVPSVSLTSPRRPPQINPNTAYPAPPLSPCVRSPEPPTSTSQMQAARASPSPPASGHGFSLPPPTPKHQVQAAQEPAVMDPTSCDSQNSPMEKSHYFNQPPSHAAFLQDPTAPDPENGDSETNKAYSDQGSESPPTFPQMEYAGSDQGNDAIPRFEEEDNFPLNPIFQSPPSDNPNATSTGFGGSGFSISAFNPFGGSAGSSKPNDAASSQPHGGFHFNQATSRNPFKFF